MAEAKKWPYEGQQLTCNEIAAKLPYSDKWTRGALNAGCTTQIEMMQYAQSRATVSREAGLRGSKRCGLRGYSY